MDKGKPQKDHKGAGSASKPGDKAGGKPASKPDAGKKPGGKK